MSHVVHVVESLGAGTLAMVQAMANGLSDRGWKVTLIYSLRDETPVNWELSFHPSIERIHLPMVREISPVKDFRTLGKLVSLLEMLGPDVVHLHSSKAGALGRLASCFVRKPRWFFSPHGLSFLQSRRSGTPHPIFLALERLLSKANCDFVACSLSEAQEIEYTLGGSAHLVKNGIDLDQIPIASHQLNVTRIGTIGRIALQRNPDLFAKLARSFAGKGIDFLWLGGGGSDEEERLRRAGVTVTGWLPHSEILMAATTLDIYVQTSLWEGLPISVLEAMAAALPVVATRIIGNIDAVDHGTTGYLVGSEDEFRARIEELIRSPQLRRDMGINGRERILADFSAAKMLERLEAAYCSSQV